MIKMLLLVVSISVACGEIICDGSGDKNLDKEEEWIQFAVCGPDYICYKCDEKLFALGKKYLKPQNIDMCSNNDSTKFCIYSFLTPLILKGKITFIRNFQAGACDGFEYAYFTPDDIILPIFADGFIIDDIQHTPNFPHWFKDGLGGEVSYEAEIGINTKNSYISLDYSACSDGSHLKTSDIKIYNKVSEKIYDKNGYMNLLEYGFLLLELNTNDSYVNLRESPNGNIIAQIQVADRGKFVLFVIGEFSETTKWYKVIYFPPNITEAKKAIIGYVHRSQVKSSWD